MYISPDQSYSDLLGLNVAKPVAICSRFCAVKRTIFNFVQS